MLCPFCQQAVVEFEPTADAALGLRCPQCGEEGVPALYPQDYDHHPAVPVSICGPSGHGKTVFVEALLTHLEREIRWPRFSFQWMDEMGMREARQRLQILRGQGHLPDATRAIFHRPQVIRLRNIPTVGGCQLLLYDTGGEAFAEAELLSKVGRYVRNSPAVLWLVSLADLDYPEQISDMMTVYANAMVRMGTDPRRQGMVIVLTKGDLLVDSPGMPAAARDFLLDDRLEPGEQGWARLEAVSDAIQNWLLGRDQRNLVNLLHAQFRQVRFCIVSAQGIAAREQTLPMRMMPRGVLAPLFWLWRESLPIAWLEPSPNAGPVPHFSLEAAVAAAPPHSTIRLSAPAYRVSAGFAIRKPLGLICPGQRVAEIIGTGEGPVVVLDTPDAEVSFTRITVRHEGLSPADVVHVRGGRATFSRCAIQGGIARQGSAEGSGDGVWVSYTATVVLHECTVEFNQNNGVRTQDRSNLSVVKSRILKNGASGILVAGAVAEVTETEMTDNGGTGVILTGAVHAKILRCTCSRNLKNGVLISRRAAAELRNNGMHENGAHGIAARDRAVVGAEGNWCGSNGGAGIALVGQVTGEIAESRCNDNKAHGIAVEEEATPNLTGNRCTKNRKCGISYSGTAGGTCVNNTSNKNILHGIRVVGDAAPEIEGNSCTANTGCGFLAEERADPVFGRNNTAEGNIQADYRPEKLRKRGWFG